MIKKETTGLDLDSFFYDFSRLPQVSQDEYKSTLSEIEKIKFDIGVLESRKDINSFIEFVIKDRNTNEYIKQGSIHRTFQKAIDENKFLVFGMPREHGKCLAKGTMIYLSDGTQIPIEDIDKSVNLLSMNHNYKIINTEGIKVEKNGIKNVYRITTKIGRKIEATSNHKFYLLDGWKELKDLNQGDKIALPRILRTNIKTKIKNKNNISKFLGYMIGDGSCTGLNKKFSCADDDILDSFKKCSSNLGFVVKKKLWCIETLGGICVRCNIGSLLYHCYDIHHVTTKPNKLRMRASYSILEEELKGCVLLCGNCHHIIRIG